MSEYSVSWAYPMRLLTFFDLLLLIVVACSCLSLLLSAIVIVCLSGEFEWLCGPVLRVVEGTVRHAVQQWRAQATITTGGNALGVDKSGNRDGSSGGSSGDNGDGGGGGMSRLSTTAGPSPEPSCGGEGEGGGGGGVLMMDEVVLVGGSSRAIPVQRAVRRALLAERALPLPLTPVPTPTTSASASAPVLPVTIISVPVPALAPASAPAECAVSTSSHEGQGGGGGMLEFCSSVDCELAVVQGLAIRGAVLSGREQTSASRLKVMCQMSECLSGRGRKIVCVVLIASCTPLTVSCLVISFVLTCQPFCRCRCRCRVVVVDVTLSLTLSCGDRTC